MWQDLRIIILPSASIRQAAYISSSKVVTIVLLFSENVQEVALMRTRLRPQPKNLSQKLRQIRIDLALSPAEIIRRLGLEDSLHVGRISEYETGVREPSLLMLLAYARLAGVHLEDIVDDGLGLPARLPGPHRSRRSGG